MGDTPPQEALISIKKWISSLLNTKRYCLLTLSWSSKFSLKLNSWRRAQGPVWFINATLALMSRNEFDNPHVSILLMRRSRLFRCTLGELRVLRLLNVSLVLYETRFWVSRLRNFSKFSSLMLQSMLHMNFVFQLLDADLMCWDPRLGFNT